MVLVRESIEFLKVLVDKPDVKVKARNLERLRTVVNASGVENQDILLEIPDALLEERSVPSVTRKVILLLCVKPKVKVLANQE